MKKWWKKSIKGIVAGGFIASAAIIAAPVVATVSHATMAKKTNSTSNETTYSYIPLQVASGYTCSSIVAAASSSAQEETLPNIYNVSPVDYPSNETLATILPKDTDGAHRSAMFLTSAASTSTIGTGQTAAKGFADPVDGYVTLTSNYTPTTTGSLQWKIPVSKTEAVPNTMKVWAKSGYTSGKLTFNDLGVYESMYALCIVSNVPQDYKKDAVKVTMTVNYSDKSTTSKQYDLYDWCYDGTATELKASTGAERNRALFHIENKTLSSTDPVKWDNLQESKYIIMNQCCVDKIDTNKLVESVEMSLDTSYSTGDTITLTVFGVTGRVTNEVLAPVSIKTHKVKESDGYHDYVTWEDEDPTKRPNYYYLDIWTQDAQGIKTLHPKYRNYPIDTSMTEWTNRKIDVTSDLESNKKYYVQMRAGNGTIQSANSNIDYIYTDAGCPVSIKCSFPTSVSLNDSTFNANVGDTVKIKTVVTNDQTEGTTTCADQNVVWEIPDAYKDWISINEAEAEGKEGEYKIWNVVPQKPFIMGTSDKLVAKAHADIEKYDNSINGNAKPNAVTPTYNNVGNKQATIAWDNPAIGKSSESNNKFRLQIAKDGEEYETKSVFNNTVDFQSGGTSKTVTGLAPDTKYKYHVRSEYKDSWSTNDDPIVSDYSEDQTFTTSYNKAKSISISPSGTIQLMLGKTNTTQDITTTVMGVDTPSTAATYQDVTWSASEETKKLIDVESAEFVQETATKHTFSAIANTAIDTEQIWTATVKDTKVTPSVTATVSVKIGVSPTTALAQGSKVTPKSFVANWTAAKRDDDSYWGDSYIINLYNGKTGKLAKSVTIEDETQTSFEFTDLDQSVKSWKYSVIVVNNGVKSAESAKVDATTANSLPTRVVVTDKTTGTEIPDLSTLKLLVGTTKTLTTKVEGQTYEGDLYDADDQKVVKSTGDSETEITVSDSTDGKTHTLNVINDAKGKTAFWLIANSKGVSGEEVSAKILVEPVAMNLHGASAIGAFTFTLTWDDLSSYSTDVKYYVDVSTDSTFKDDKQFVVKNKELASNVTSLTVSDLDAGITYYYRAKYVYNNISSEYRSGSVKTDDAVGSFTLNKWSMSIIGNNSDTTLEATTESSFENLDVEWELSDDTICDVEEIDYVSNDTYTQHHRYKITGKNSGTTVLTMHPKGFAKITDQCTINVVKGELEPVRAWANNITSRTFDLRWSSLKDWSGNAVNYKVNVWYMKGNKQKFVYKDYITTSRVLKLGQKKSIPTNTTYYCTVEAFNNNYETKEYNTVEVTLTEPFPWWIVGTAIGSTVGGWLLLSYILYIFWKKSILKTYDQKKVKDKVKGEKVKTHDKYFRVIDKACVATNKKIAKRSNSLMTRLGTKNEQEEKYGKK